jgi:Tol biopolymer transport system component
LALIPGTRLGVYDITARIGEGGMGQVFRARDTKLDRDVAIKVLPEAFAHDADRLARFTREAKTLASLNHPHIAGIYGLEESAGVSALVMELVEGEDLAQRIARGAISLDEALPIARQIAEALEAAHEQGIVHRDLKPANIKVRADGTVKVLDFGLAKAMDPTSSSPANAMNSPTLSLHATMHGVILGTAPYMSPEQARGKSVDKRTDIWAFGCVLFEMLAGRRAFTGETTTDVLAKIVEREPDWTSVPPSTPPHVVQVLRRCLEKDPKKRLRDIGDARPMFDGVSIAPIQETAAASRRGIAVYGFGIVAAVLLGAAVMFGLSARFQATAGPTVSRVVRLSTGPAFDHSPAISPDGKWVAYLSDVRGVTDVWVKVVSGGDPINLTAAVKLDVTPQTDSGGLAISPDGSQIAFNASPRDQPGRNDVIGTWVIPAPFGGPPRRILESGRAARWSPDGKRLAFIVQGGTGGDAIWVADADGANPREVAPRRGGMHKHWAAWSHDSRYIYFNYSTSGLNAEPSELYRVPAAGGPIEAVVTTIRRAIYPALTADGKGLIFAANPKTVDLGLWWRAISGGATRQLTIGVGEYAEPVVTPDGRRLVAALMETKQSLVSMPAIANVPSDRMTTITNGDEGDLDPTVSPDGRSIVFSSTRSGSRNLWTARPDGRDARPLTSGDAIDERPMFSPDGRQIAFVSDRGDVRGIWLINSDGGSPRLLTKVLVLDSLSWSRNGSQLVFAVPGDSMPRLALVSVATGAMRPLATPGPASYPVWSPADDVIAYLESQANTNAPSTVHVRFLDVNGRPQAIPVFEPPNLGNSLFAWRPDGHALSIVSNSGSLPSVAWVVEPGDSTAHRMVTEFTDDTRIRGLTWSPDGTSLIVGRQKRTSDIVLLDLEK